MADGKREYVAIFAIGAKLLGSFKGALAQAKSRLLGLARIAKTIGGVAKGIGIAFTGMIAGIAGTAIGMLGRGIWSMFKQIFEGAAANAEKAADTHRTLLAYLKQDADFRKKGIAFTENQITLLGKHNEKLAEQTGMSTDIYDEANKTLVTYGAMPHHLAEMSGPLGDMLAATKGPRANIEDMAQLTHQVGNAIIGGPIKQLQRMGLLQGEVTKNWSKMTKEQRYQKILAGLKKFEGEAKKAMDTPIGRIVKFHNAMDKLSNTIGEILLPVMGDVADTWRQFLETPAVQQGMVAAAKLWAAAMKGIVGYIQSDVIPAFSKLVSFWQDHPELQEGIINIAKNLGIATVAAGAFALAVSVNPMFWLAGAVIAVGVLANNWDSAARSASEYVKQQEAAGKGDTFMTKMVKLLDDFTTGLDLVGVAIDHYLIDPLNKAAGQLNKISAGWAKIPGLGWTAPAQIPMQEHVAIAGARERLALKALPLPKPPSDEAMPTPVDVYRGAKGNIAGPLQEIKTASENTAPAMLALQQSTQSLGATTQQSAPAVSDFVTNLNGVTTAAPAAASELQQVMAALRMISTITAPSIIPGAMPATPAAVAPAPATAPVAQQFGGIHTKPTLAMVGEAGPEAVIPLSGGPRSEGLLSYANRAVSKNMPAAATPAAGPTTVHFTPSVVINGNASKEEQAALDTKLRSLARDFIEQFKAAQYQERRLSYESGYG